MFTHYSRSSLTCAPPRSQSLVRVVDEPPASPAGGKRGGKPPAQNSGGLVWAARTTANADGVGNSLAVPTAAVTSIQHGRLRNIGRARHKNRRHRRLRCGPLQYHVPDPHPLLRRPISALYVAPICKRPLYMCIAQTFATRLVLRR